MTAATLGRLALAPALLAGLVPAPAPAQEATAPAPAAAKVRADIYDPKADARATIAAAARKAKRDGSRVLVMFGGNWCGWCHKLDDMLTRGPADVRTAMRNEYVLAHVDTAAPNAKAVMEEFKVDPQAGVPYLVVLDGDGRLVCGRETGSLEEGDRHDPAKVLAFLKAQAAPPVDARKALDEALAQAATRDKLVFLHFGAPWCGWCHKLEDFLARDDVAAIMARDFIDRKIDTDRMAGGKDLQEKFGAAKKGIPWFAFLDRDGKVVADSDGPMGNVGYPAAPEEIAHFVAMLRKAARTITPGQIDAIEATLKVEGEKIQAARR